MPKSTSPGGSEPPRPRAGRPRRSTEQRAAAKERRIPPSVKGRLKFLPGYPHALDVQMREARNYRGLIAAKLAEIQAVLSHLDTQDQDPGAAISEQENALKSFLWSTYEKHKHREHILATFLAIRRARLLAKLDAAFSALEMAADLLEPDDRLLAELQAAVEHQRRAAARPDGNGEQPQGAALVRVTGPDEAAIRAQLDLLRIQRQEKEDAISRIDHRHIYGDTQGARQRLSLFEEQARTIRAAISPAIGWFEEFYIEKVRMSRAALKYLKRGESLPPGVDLWEGVIYGPYLKYRWQEMTNGPQYTIQMGIVPEGEGSALDDDEEGGDPFPNF